MTYRFRPSLFRDEQTVTLDAAGISLIDGRWPARRIPWTAIEEVHVEPGTTPDDGPPRWLINLAVKGQPGLQIDSVYVRGAVEFERKTDEFLAVLATIHEALAPRATEVRFRFGMRSGIVWAWRGALVLTLLTGILATIAAIYAEEWEALFGAVAFVGVGLSGLSMLRRRRGPRPYDPSGFSMSEVRATQGEAEGQAKQGNKSADQVM